MKKNQELDAANKLYQNMQRIIRANLSRPDKEKYVFLTNQLRGKSAPFEFARRYGFIIPIFKIKKAYNKDGKFLITHEAWWVKNQEIKKNADKVNSYIY